MGKRGALLKSYKVVFIQQQGVKVQGRSQARTELLLSLFL